MVEARKGNQRQICHRVACVLRLQEDKRRITWVSQNPALSKLWMVHWLKEVLLASWTQEAAKIVPLHQGQRRVIAIFLSSDAKWNIFSSIFCLHKDTSTKSWFIHWFKASVAFLSWAPCPSPLSHSHSICFWQDVPIVCLLCHFSTRQYWQNLPAMLILWMRKIETQRANSHLFPPWDT